MRWLIMFTILILCGALHAEEITGTWIGTFRIADADRPIRIEFSKSADQLKGKVDLILDEVKGAEINSIQLASNQLKFSVPIGEKNLEFTGKVFPKSIDGEQLHLVKIAKLTREETSDIFGLYVLDNNESVAIRTWDELGDFQPTAFHGDGKIRALYPQSSSQYFSGSGLLIPLPQKSTYTFTKTNSGMILNYREGGKEHSR